MLSSTQNKAFTAMPIASSAASSSVNCVPSLPSHLRYLGDMPELVESDNLGAATHKLRDSKDRDFNKRYKEIPDRRSAGTTITPDPGRPK